MINILVFSCKTCNTKYSPISECDLYLLHKKECSLSTAEQFQYMLVTDIFNECKILQLVEDAAIHVIRKRMSLSSLPNKSIEFKTEGPRVGAIFGLKS